MSIQQREDWNRGLSPGAFQCLEAREMRRTGKRFRRGAGRTQRKTEGCPRSQRKRGSWRKGSNETNEARRADSN